MPEPTGPLATPPAESAKVAAAKAEAVVQEVKHAPKAEKRRLAIDQRLLMTEVQLLLADKRTAFALLRTGVTVSLVPLSLWTFLIGTSKLWNPFDVMWILVPFALVTSLLFALGIYLVSHALAHVRHTEAVLTGLRSSDTMLEELMMAEGRGHQLLGRFTRVRGDRA